MVSVSEHVCGIRKEGIFVVGKESVDLSECYFYHTVDVPGVGLLDGEWDLRNNARDYFGGIDYNGKKVLEMGTSSGYGCFTMEKWGAEVVGYDLSPEYSWDLVPSGASTDVLDEKRVRMAKWIGKVNNAFWYLHGKFQSKAKVVYGSAYMVPESIGLYDVVTLCSILLHTRDPFGILQSVSKFSSEYIVITDVIPKYLVGDKVEEIVFRPQRELSLSHSGGYATWWYLPPTTISAFVKLLGFKDVAVSFHDQLWHDKGRCEYKKVGCYTVVGRR